MSSPSPSDRPKATTPTSLSGLLPFLRPYRLQIGLLLISEEPLQKTIYSVLILVRRAYLMIEALDRGRSKLQMLKENLFLNQCQLVHNYW